MSHHLSFLANCNFVRPLLLLPLPVLLSVLLLLVVVCSWLLLPLPAFCHRRCSASAASAAAAAAAANAHENDRHPSSTAHHNTNNCHREPFAWVLTVTTLVLPPQLDGEVHGGAGGRVRGGDEDDRRRHRERARQVRGLQAAGQRGRGRLPRPISKGLARGLVWASGSVSILVSVLI